LVTWDSGHGQLPHHGQMAEHILLYHTNTIPFPFLPTHTMPCGASQPMAASLAPHATRPASVLLLPSPCHTPHHCTGTRLPPTATCILGLIRDHGHVLLDARQQLSYTAAGALVTGKTTCPHHRIVPGTVCLSCFRHSVIFLPLLPCKHPVLPVPPATTAALCLALDMFRLLLNNAWTLTPRVATWDGRRGPGIPPFSRLH